MPIKENGERIDIIFNALGVVNRLNSQQLFEQSITFIMSRTVERMMEMYDNAQDIDDILALMIRILNYFNEEESAALASYISKLSKEEKYEFLDEVCVEGMNVHIPPMLWNDPVYNKIKTIYAENPWIKPYKVYVKKFGRYIEMLNELYTGSMYIMKLKQSAKKGLSVRSTGHISHRGLPEKTKRSHRELYSKTPIRIGGDENNNMNIGVRSEIINQLHMFYRSSVHGRQSLAEKLASGDPSKLVVSDLVGDLPLVADRNVEILNSYNKILGFKMVFEESDKTVMAIDTVDRGEIHELKDGSFFMGSQEGAIKANLRLDVIRRMNRSVKDLEIMTSDEYDKMIDAEVERIYNSR